MKSRRNESTNFEEAQLDLHTGVLVAHSLDFPAVLLRVRMDKLSGRLFPSSKVDCFLELSQQFDVQLDESVGNLKAKERKKERKKERQK